MYELNQSDFTQPLPHYYQVVYAALIVMCILGYLTDLLRPTRYASDVIIEFCFKYL